MKSKRFYFHCAVTGKRCSILGDQVASTAPNVPIGDTTWIYTKTGSKIHVNSDPNDIADMLEAYDARIEAEELAEVAA